MDRGESAMLTEVKVNISFALFEYLLRHSYKEVTLSSEQLINIAPLPVVSARASERVCRVWLQQRSVEPNSAGIMCAGFGRCNRTSEALMAHRIFLSHDSHQPV